MKSILSVAALLMSSAALAAPADVAKSAAADTRSERNVALDASRKPVELLQWAEIEQGDRVLDIFGANLYWAEIVAPAIGSDGRYTIWQPTQFFGEPAQAATGAFVQAYPYGDIATARFEDMTFEDGAYDFIILNLNAHDFWFVSERFDIPEMDPTAHVQEVADALAPGGKLLLIDHRGAPTDDPRAQVNALHRIDPAAIIDVFGDAGLYLKGTNDALTNDDDDLSLNVFDEAIAGKTSRFVHLFVKPE